MSSLPFTYHYPLPFLKSVRNLIYSPAEPLWYLTPKHEAAWERVVTDEEELDLIEKAKTDTEAFGALYERYVDRIYSYIYYRVGNNSEAEDLTARVFHRVLKALPRYTDRGAPFVSWLYRIAHNLVANHHRDQSRRPATPLDELPLTSPNRDLPDQVVERQDEERWLWKVINDLHEDRRELLVLKFNEGLSNAQIGEIMGRTEGAIKSLYHRTLVTLREELERRGIKRSSH